MAHADQLLKVESGVQHRLERKIEKCGTLSFRQRIRNTAVDAQCRDEDVVERAANRQHRQTSSTAERRLQVESDVDKNRIARAIGHIVRNQNLLTRRHLPVRTSTKHMRNFERRAGKANANCARRTEQHAVAERGQQQQRRCRREARDRTKAAAVDIVFKPVVQIVPTGGAIGTKEIAVKVGIDLTDQVRRARRIRKHRLQAAVKRATVQVAIRAPLAITNYQRRVAVKVDRARHGHSPLKARRGNVPVVVAWRRATEDEEAIVAIQRIFRRWRVPGKRNEAVEHSLEVAVFCDTSGVGRIEELDADRGTRHRCRAGHADLRDTVVVATACCGERHREVADKIQ